jgi:putative PIN family toxin of toxin-antitoxin system
MASKPRPKVVIDTNVVFEGLTQQGGASGYIIETWLADVLDVRVSNALAYEYVDVLSRKLTAKRWNKVKPLLGILLDKAQFVTVYFSWRPISPDKADDHIVDCAMNAGATVITSNLKHFRAAHTALGLAVLSPLDLVLQLAHG